MNRNKLKLPDNRGITLVETIVASLIMVIGTLMLSTGFIASARMMSVSSAERKAAQSITAAMNGGPTGSTTAVDDKYQRMIFSIEGIKDIATLTFEGQVWSYTDDSNEDVAFYRYLE